MQVTISDFPANINRATINNAYNEAYYVNIRCQ